MEGRNHRHSLWKPLFIFLIPKYSRYIEGGMSKFEELQYCSVFALEETKHHPIISPSIKDRQLVFNPLQGLPRRLWGSPTF